MLSLRTPFGLSLLLVASYGMGQSPTLQIGDPAPKFAPTVWLKGDPKSTPKKGRPYVVEFWATWCGPCKAAMPHLSKLAKQYRGKIDFIGADAFEGNELAKVKKFVAAGKPLMDYSVVADGPKGRLGKDWVSAAGETGIPVAFLVKTDGRIGWIGNPSDLDRVLPLVLSGKLDLQVERQLREANRDPMNAVNLEMAAANYEEVVKLVDRQRKAGPNYALFGAIPLFNALAHLDPAELERRATAELQKNPSDFGIPNAITLALSGPGLSSAAYRFGARVAAEAADHFPAKFMLYNRAAEMAKLGGEPKEAIRLLELALEVANEDQAITDARREEVRTEISRLKQILAESKPGEDRA